MTNDPHLPTCEKDGDGWVIKAFRAAPVRVENRTLAHWIFELAMWCYHNGEMDAQRAIRDSLGIER